MKKKIKVQLAITALFLFALWTVMLCVVDVQPIGPRRTAVGFATVNGWFHNLTGTHMWLYTVTDWLGLVPVTFGIAFAVLGLCQWIKRRKIQNVDLGILALGGYYIVVLAAYLLFEEIVINYRPVLIGGNLEPSYPSSTTLLVLCVMPTAMLQLKNRIKSKHLCKLVMTGIILFMVFMVLGRLISGVHWLTDIIGGLFLSTGFVMLYSAVCHALNELVHTGK